MTEQQTAPPTDAARQGLKGRSAQSMNAMRDALAKQEKIRINIPRPSHIKKGLNHMEVVTINGYSMSIPTGKVCNVPEEVYLILVRAGKITPQRDEDEHEVPALVTMEGDEYSLMGSAGTLSNPVAVG